MTLDGNPLGKRIDLYDTKVTTADEISLGTAQLEKGSHRLKATAIGRDTMSLLKSNYNGLQ